MIIAAAIARQGISASPVWYTSSPPTWNGADKSANITVGDGNLVLTWGVGGGLIRGTQSVVIGAAGYLIFTVGLGASISGGAGFANSTMTTAAVVPGGSSDANGWGYYWPDGHKYNGGDQGAYGDTAAAKDMFTFLLNIASGKIFVARNGVWQGSGNPNTGANAMFTIAAATTVFPALAGDALQTVSTYMDLNNRS